MWMKWILRLWYYKDTNLNWRVHKIYMATIWYDTSTVFLITVNGHTVKELLDTGAEKSCMNMDTFEKLNINNLDSSFMPAVKGATGNDMLAQGESQPVISP